ARWVGRAPRLHELLPVHPPGSLLHLARRIAARLRETRLQQQVLDGRSPQYRPLFRTLRAPTLREPPLHPPAPPSRRFLAVKVGDDGRRQLQLGQLGMDLATRY